MRKLVLKLSLLLVMLIAVSCTSEPTLEPIESIQETDNGLTEEEFTYESEEVTEGRIAAKHRFSKTNAEVMDFVNGGVVGKATLIRGRNGIFVKVKTSNLIPGHAYTLWWVVWNNPENCAVPGACVDTDFANADQVKVEVMYATGRLVRWSGRGHFWAYLSENDASGTSNPFFGLSSYGGLLDSKKAEVHAVVRSHGPAVPGQIWDQLTSYEGGCTTFFPPFTEIPDVAGECGDIHAAIFAPL